MERSWGERGKLLFLLISKTLLYPQAGPKLKILIQQLPQVEPRRALMRGGQVLAEKARQGLLRRVGCLNGEGG
jgi:hypothetical protein